MKLAFLWGGLLILRLGHSMSRQCPTDKKGSQQGAWFLLNLSLKIKLVEGEGFEPSNS